MDVVAFVGFASAGPVGIPVAVEDPGQFRDIFGPPLVLLREGRTGRTVHAQLYPAVEMFFRNGGRRCHVMRVAKDPHVRQFRLPGVVDGATGVPVGLRARSGGTWSDGVRSSAVLQRRAIVLTRFEGTSARVTMHLGGRADEIIAGDLVHLNAGNGLEAFVTADRMVSADPGSLVLEGRARWVVRRNPALIDPVTVRVDLVSPSGSRRLPEAQIIQGEGDRPGCTLHFSRAFEAAIVPGDVLHVIVPSKMRVHRAIRAWLPVADVNVSASGAVIVASEALWPAAPSAAVISALARTSGYRTRVAHRLRFDLYASEEGEGVQHVSDMSFTDLSLDRGGRGAEAQMPGRFPGHLPDDDAIFSSAENDDRFAAGGLLYDVRSPRFAFAAGSVAGAVLVPLGMPSAFMAGEGRPPEPLSGDARAQSIIVREGLDASPAELFLDAGLASSATAALEARVFDRLYVRRENLTGLHALWALDEVSTIALPDAAHGRFEWAAGRVPSLLGAPELQEPAWIEDARTVRLTWTGPAGSPLRFDVQESTQPDFGIIDRTTRSSVRQLELRVAGCGGQRYARVRGRRGTEVGPWSNTVTAFLPPEPFKECAPVLAAPVVRLAPVKKGTRPGARWTAVNAAERYELIVGSDPDFLASQRVPGLPEEHTTAAGMRYFLQNLGEHDPSLPLYARVRAIRNGTVGPWSGTLLIDPVSRSGWTASTDGAGSRAGLLSIHRALIRMCAVRADCFALLGLPESYTSDEALEYVNALRSAAPGGGVPPIRADEEVLFSYSALHHPWAAVALESGILVDAGPEGIVAGSVARRTLERGAWIAPAEIDFKGVIGLNHRLTEEKRLALRRAHINPLVESAGRFVASGARTLSADPEWDQVNVRRLMMLLRKVLLLEGNLFVFDTNDDTLRRRITVRLEETFTYLFRRGAFAGRSVADAFRIDASRRLNRQDELDRGRLLVEIRFAPSRPLVFLVIRLLQRELEGLTVAEV
jgi:hypothetical protein